MIFTFKILYSVVFPLSLFDTPSSINYHKYYVVENNNVIQILDWLVELNPFISDAYVQDTFTENDISYLTMAIVVEEHIYKRLMLTNPSPTIILKVPYDEDLEFKTTFSNMERIE